MMKQSVDLNNSMTLMNNAHDNTSTSLAGLARRAQSFSTMLRSALLLAALLLVGISSGRGTKQHSCRIEELTK